jgi:hypothetical protein
MQALAETLGNHFRQTSLRKWRRQQLCDWQARDGMPRVLKFGDS